MAYYEWWCPRCRVTHPPGRKECVHCGGRVQPSRDGASAFDPRAAPEARLDPTVRVQEEPAGTPAEAAPEARRVRGVRIATTAAWILLAVLATLLRMCQEPR